MSKKFAAHKHLPYTKTLLGAGPNGETVVFQVDKKNPAFAEGLIEKFKKTAFLQMQKGDDYYVWSYNGRLYVIGSAEMSKKFEAHKHLPYTRTLLGAGPNGETVIFEVNKKDKSYVQRLEDTYKATPYQLDSNNKDYFVYKYNGRVFVIGDKKMSEKFEAHKHLPYTRTILGAGPNGETVVFQVDKKNPALTERIQSVFSS
jgi:hypothetical protein